MFTETMPVPIERNTDGVLRVGGTRVTLDTLVTAFLAGATAEEIALRYPCSSWLTSTRPSVTIFKIRRKWKIICSSVSNRLW